MLEKFLKSFGWMRDSEFHNVLSTNAIMSSIFESDPWSLPRYKVIVCDTV